MKTKTIGKDVIPMELVRLNTEGQPHFESLEEQINGERIFDRSGRYSAQYSDETNRQMYDGMVQEEQGAYVSNTSTQDRWLKREKKIAAAMEASPHPALETLYETLYKFNINLFQRGVAKKFRKKEKEMNEMIDQNQIVRSELYDHSFLPPQIDLDGRIHLDSLPTEDELGMQGKLDKAKFDKEWRVGELYRNYNMVEDFEKKINEVKSSLKELNRKGVFPGVEVKHYALMTERSHYEGRIQDLEIERSAIERGIIRSEAKIMEYGATVEHSKAVLSQSDQYITGMQQSLAGVSHYVNKNGFNPRTTHEQMKELKGKMHDVELLNKAAEAVGAAIIDGYNNLASSQSKYRPNTLHKRVHARAEEFTQKGTAYTSDAVDHIISEMGLKPPGRSNYRK